MGSIAVLYFQGLSLEKGCRAEEDLVPAAFTAKQHDPTYYWVLCARCAELPPPPTPASAFTLTWESHAKLKVICCRVLWCVLPFHVSQRKC